MAVAPMRRVEIVGYRPVLDEVLEALQRAGALQVECAPEELSSETIPPDDVRRRRLEEYAADARFVRDFLSRFRSSEQPFSAFVSEKFHLDVDEFGRLAGSTALLHVYRVCEGLSDGIASAERERARLVALMSDLEPWRDVRLQIGQWNGTEHATLIAGTVPEADAARVRQALREVTPLVSVAEFGGRGARQAWIVLVHHSCVNEVRSTLAATRFTETTFTALEDYPAEEAEVARDRIAELERRLEELRERAVQVAEEHYAEAVAVVEAIDSDKAAVDVRDRVGRTERTFVVTGWLRASREDELLLALTPWEADLDAAFSDPTEQDNPPVELDNPRWLKPFELLTDMYGRPGYRELDPTPLLAPFFLLFFAICIGDVGYGALLMLGAWLVKSKLDVADTVKRFCNLMMIGGGGAMVVGVAFRSYFAMDGSWLPPFMRYRPLLDPLDQIEEFLIAMVVIGVVQVFFGIGVAAYDAFRRGDPGTAVFEQISTIFLCAMLATSAVTWSSDPTIGRASLVVGLLGTMLMKGRTFERALNGRDLPLPDRGAGWVWLALMLAWVFSLAFDGPPAIGWVLLGVTAVGLAVSASVRACVVSFLGGAYAVYGMSSLLGDVLSYTRLAALGLSGTLVGWVFNILASLVWGPVRGLWESGGAGYLWAVVVAVLAAAVFAFGHVFNVGINLLGAFVHPARLQFVEFFSKFYKGNGRPLAPFRFATRSVVLHAGSARQEGGAAS